MQKLFPGIGVEVFATDKDDIQKEDIMARVKKAMGADYGTGVRTGEASGSVRFLQ